MRKLILTTAAVAAAIAGTFAGEPTHPENPDSSYADYCIKFEDGDTTIAAKLLLVKEYKKLEPIRLDPPKTFRCKILSGAENYYFDAVEKKISELHREFPSAGMVGQINSWGSAYGHGEIILGPVIPISHTSELLIFMPHIDDRIKDKWKKGLLSLKENTYTDANVNVWRKCSTFDTSFQVNYRVRLIGECKQTR
jgi:hypothetical protein